MMNNTLPPRRPNSMRHPDADYSDPGIYFITICAHNRINLFGKTINEVMITNEFGLIVWKVWKTLPERFPQISIDAAIVMPDHFHGIVIIHEAVTSTRGEEKELTFSSGKRERRKMLLPLVVGYIKMNSAKQINLLRGTPGSPIWQRNYFDRIIRDDRDYDDLTEYILTNPIRWGIDPD